jgi:hypothetical protein
VPDQIAAERLIALGYELVDEGRSAHHSRFVQRLREAQQKVASQATLGSLLQPAPAAVPADHVPRG